MVQLKQFEIPPVLAARLVNVSMARSESMQDCILTMLERGLDLEEVFGPVEIADDMVVELGDAAWDEVDGSYDFFAREEI